jgi:hypothetical protein
MPMHETAERLRANVASAYGMPDHLRDALHAWVESVEERLGAAHAPPAAPDDAAIRAAVEAHMAENADAYAGERGEPGPPGEKGEPGSSQSESVPRDPPAETVNDEEKSHAGEEHQS